jgi:hypothetical protein
MDSVTPSNDVFDSLKCVVCFEISRDAVECLTCGNIFCRMCVYNIKCPLCRSHSAYKDSYFARKIIECMPIKCEFCSETTTKGKVQEHLDKCQGRNYKCKNVKCSFEGKREAFLKHIEESHQSEILNDFDANPSNLINNRVYNLFNARINAVGKPAVRGYSGKFYCGEKSDITCGSCDGNCGPSNGCQCTDCMKIDREFYNLPGGFMLNHQGNLCQLIQNKFYCGTREGNRNCCPDNGSCTPCDKVSNSQLIIQKIKAQLEKKC